MNGITLGDLQESVRDRTAFTELSHYVALARAYLEFLHSARLTQITSPSDPRYLFSQYSAEASHSITRPLNSQLFEQSLAEISSLAERFMGFLSDLRRYQEKLPDTLAMRQYLEGREINRFVYTVQQSIGCISDSFSDSNQSRKRVGQLFERLIRLILQEIGLMCESRTVSLPIPNYPGYVMSYELDLVFARERAIVSSETRLIHPTEVVGSVKTSSKDRLDKVFLDKYLLSRLLERDVTVIAIFLHDVQRARRGNSIFGINSTFKSNHFLGYTVALNRLDGVYYVDPRPEMLNNPKLNSHIADFQRFLTQDIWLLTG